MATLTFQSVLISESCYLCGVQFAIPEELHRTLLARKAGQNFWCPNGHPQHFIGESDKAKAERLARELTHAQDLIRSAQAAREKSAKETKRLKKRIGNGVCPCCHRSFLNVQRHMKSQHPEFAPA